MTNADTRSGRRSAWESPTLGITESGREAQPGELPQNRQQRLRTDRAIRADALNIFVLQLLPHVLRTPAAECGSLFRVRHLRHDRQSRKRPDRVNRRQQFLEIHERFQQEKIHAALFERPGLLLENSGDLFGGQIAYLADDSQRAD